ncbi:MAG: LysR family transcriptional regulator [Phycisphaeraceae bacterium]|nr:LysR family transcriptional regulator [Phycisphaeraceae bacterium]
MELTPLRYLRAIADAGTMTVAAQRLGLSQPTLSAAVRKMEEELGVDLFSRTGRGLTPTEACLVLLEHTDPAVRSVDAGVRAVRALAGLEAGTVRVGAGATVVTYLLPGVVQRFRQRYADLRVSVREAGSSQVAEALLKGELDLGVVTLPVNIPGSNELMTVARAQDELRLIAPPGHALAGRADFAWQDLVGEAVVGFEAGSSVRAVIDQAAAAHGVMLEVVVELRSIEGIARMVRAGVGVGFVSRMALGEGTGLACRDGRLVRGLALVRRRDRSPAPAAGAFEQDLTRAMAAVL